MNETEQFMLKKKKSYKSLKNLKVVSSVGMDAPSEKLERGLLLL